jgi:hypothetical protein
MLVLCHEFSECGPNSAVAQMNSSFHLYPGHFARSAPSMPPYAEAKLMRCTRVAIADAVDVRRKSQKVVRSELER